MTGRNDGGGNDVKWLFFSYSVPTQPSRARVSVWRQLKKMGAVNCLSFWVLPHHVDRITVLEKLSAEITAYQGESMLIEGKTLGPEDEARIKLALMESGNEEYGELLHKCNDFLLEIEMETKNQNFIFGEVEENEEELDKLKKWLNKIEKRNPVNSPLRKDVLKKIKRCEKALDDFSRAVYDRVHGKKD
ncbi:MAG TPA: hypothetical protein PKB11_11015 [Desulfovibrio sp.]|uniref:Chromate resistance protein ChrB n=1 Tax=Desulfovibrio sp. TaxID=885 RepID=UPI002BAA9FFA|nr:Chromate resistance protein ChrB [Desulfovibrio sp.]HMM39275.1 hypothetical protein [Desulfovibrio sp.]